VAGAGGVTGAGGGVELVVGGGGMAGVVGAGRAGFFVRFFFGFALAAGRSSGVRAGASFAPAVIGSAERPTFGLARRLAA
jgi:hypothetical protein